MAGFTNVMRAALLISLSYLACSCCQRCPRERQPIGQRFVHKYGMELSREEWEARGKQGEVISTLRDGSTICEHFDHGQLQGERSATFPHSEVAAEVQQFERGQLVSSQENYHSGAPKERTSLLANGTLIETWYESGVPRTRERLVNGLLMEGAYFQTDHTREGGIEAGHGTRFIRNILGELEAEESYFEGACVLRKNLYPNGEPKEILHFCKGEKEGECAFYLPGGVPERVEEWSHGKLHGSVITFENGRPVMVMPYVNGLRHGLEKHYAPSGELAAEINWCEDHRHGPSHYYAGRNATTEWYYEGEAVHYKTYERLEEGIGVE